MNTINKIYILILIFLLLFAFSLNVMACDPPVPECYSDSVCATCYWCDNPGESTADCVCATVTGITLGSEGPFGIGDTISVTAAVSHSLPSGCSIDWDDSSDPNTGITFAPDPTDPNNPTKAIATIVGVVGTTYIRAKTSCQSSWTSSSTFTVNGVLIQLAYIVDNQILVAIKPTGQSGTLKLELMDESESNVYTILNATRTSSLDMEETFGDIGSITAGEYKKVKATWTVDSWEPTDEYPQPIKVLGVYRHSTYNIPKESCARFTGSNEDFCYTSATADNCTATNCSWATNGQAKSDWLDAQKLNGSGQCNLLGNVTTEGFCQTLANPPAPPPAGCNTSHQLRSLTGSVTGCPKCSGLPLTANLTVAINPSHPDLSCGKKVLIYTQGVKTVTDTGSGVATNQLDNFIGVDNCSTPTDLGNFMTIRLDF